MLSEMSVADERVLQCVAYEGQTEFCVYMCVCVFFLE